MKRVADILNEWTYNPTRNPHVSPERRRLAEDAVSLMHFRRTRCEDQRDVVSASHADFVWAGHSYKICIRQIQDCGGWWTYINDQWLNTGRHDTRVEAIQVIIRMMVSGEIEKYSKA